MARHYEVTREEFVQATVDEMQRETFVRLVLSQPAQNATCSKLSIRPVSIGGRVQLQITRHRTDSDDHSNIELNELKSELEQVTGPEFRRAHLFTTERDVSAKLKASGRTRCQESLPSKTAADRDLAHNRTKQYLIPENQACDFLIAIGVMTREGKVRRKHFDKFRQINRYLEFIDDVADRFSQNRPIRVVDFGCGKSYLTFALHHLLTKIKSFEVEILGLDLKARVVKDCNAIAQQLSCEGLSFALGNIWDAELPVREIDLCVSLHACDTATDAALQKAVEWNAEAILAVPCCQHELASKMSADFVPPIQQFGIHRERMATMATDSLRALALQTNGYQTQVVEFIDTEHTPKNVLIRAVKASDSDSHRIHRARSEYQSLKAQLGVESLATDGLLGVS